MKKTTLSKKSAKTTKTTKVASDTSPKGDLTGPPMPPDSESEAEGGNGDFDPYDAEAWAWMTNKDSIKKARAPIHYIGEDVSKGLSQDILHRSMNVEEAQHLVQPDGGLAMCALEGTEFQPVRYLPFIPKSLKDEIASGMKLTEIELPYGGSYYVNRDEKPVPISGAVFAYNKYTERFELCKTSPLVIMSERMPRRNGNKKQWGVPLDLADRKHAARVKNNDRYRKADEIIKTLSSQPSKGFARIGDAFPSKPNWKSGKKGGKPSRNERNREKE